MLASSWRQKATVSQCVRRNSFVAESLQQNLRNHRCFVPARDKATVSSMTDLVDGPHVPQEAISISVSLFDHLNASPVVHI